MHIDFLLDTFEANEEKDALIWKDQVFSYDDLLKAISKWQDSFQQNQIKPCTIISVESDFSLNAVALLLALIEHNCTIVPLTESVKDKKDEFREIAEVETTICINADDTVEINKINITPKHQILTNLKAIQHPGLILFSSGSTGKSKAAVHDFLPLLEKFKTPRHSFRTITFLLFDHIGGVNTLLYTLSNGGCVITVQDRSPHAICSQIQKHKVEILPTSPTFVNLLLLSEAYEDYDLGSLQMVTYGTEVMPESTLQRFHALFPNIKLLQTYGLSELGILRSKSKSSDSLWVKVGGEDFQTRIVDGMLEIKATSAMLGYLNAPSPFSEDGWFKTGDAVETEGDYIKILGRKSEIINVGGEKVYPAEIEGILQTMENVEDVVVTSEPNPITGQMVKACVKLSSDESLSDFRKRMRSFCKDKMPRYKIPQKVVLSEKSSHSDRFKKIRLGH